MLVTCKILTFPHYLMWDYWSVIGETRILFVGLASWSAVCWHLFWVLSMFARKTDVRNGFSAKFWAKHTFFVFSVDSGTQSCDSGARMIKSLAADHGSAWTHVAQGFARERTYGGHGLDWPCGCGARGAISTRPYHGPRDAHWLASTVTPRDRNCDPGSPTDPPPARKPPHRRRD